MTVQATANRFGCAAYAQAYDVFNGDADGICALHQLRMAEPRAAQLVTGTKREIELLQRVPTVDQIDVTVLDISFDSNLPGLKRILDAGGRVTYFDHHSASKLFEHPNLHTYLDDAPQVCTSLLVDQYLGGRYRQWALVAAFGDNLIGRSHQLARELGLTESHTNALCEIGFLLNYNAYGESLADLHMTPEALYSVVHQFAEPIDFASAPAYTLLAEHYRQDAFHMDALMPEWAGKSGVIYILPCTPWARRISGMFANKLIANDPYKSYGVLTQKIDGNYVVSVRSSKPDERSASGLCDRFASGGGRRSAAGINTLPANDVERFVASFAAYFDTSAGIDSAAAQQGYVHEQ
ncbi:MAG: DHH family phosphoesterase, partial [Pseudomonadota bacterium]